MSVLNKYMKVLSKKRLNIQPTVLHLKQRRFKK